MTDRYRQTRGYVGLVAALCSSLLVTACSVGDSSMIPSPQSSSQVQPAAEGPPLQRSVELLAPLRASMAGNNELSFALGTVYCAGTTTATGHPIVVSSSFAAIAAWHFEFPCGAVVKAKYYIVALTSPSISSNATATLVDGPARYVPEPSGRTSHVLGKPFFFYPYSGAVPDGSVVYFYLAMCKTC